MPLVLCIAAAIITYYAGRRSLVAGLLSVFGIGYAYGILRANVQSTAIYFLFDSAVIGLYAAQFSAMKQQFMSQDGRHLKHWVLLLTLWPVILFFVPLQDPLIQVVGLRGNIFFLPMILLGARLTREKLYPLALGVAVLNIPALILAIAEYRLGIELFFPHNVLTELIYSSNDVGALGAYRIPSSFPNAHAYAGTMVMTLPLLLGAWVQRHPRRSHQVLLMAGIISAVLGVFLSAVRTHFIVMIVVLAVFILSARVRPGLKLVFTMLLIGIGLLVAQQDRLQRFATLRDTHYVERRVHSSVNASFLDAIEQYPFGNGLGGGGTSIPAFLQDRLHAPLLIESEYGRALLETGIIGLALWISFLLWFVTRRNHSGRREPWLVGRRIAWYACVCCFAQGLVGVGLLLSIPQSVMLWMSVGWVAIPQNDQPALQAIPFSARTFRRAVQDGIRLRIPRQIGIHPAPESLQ
jgi:hypothetical protein